MLNWKWYKLENVKNEGNSLVCCFVNFIDFFCPFTTETSFVSAATKTIKHKHTSNLCIHIVRQRKERLNGKLKNIVEENFFLLLYLWFVLGELRMLKWTLKSALNRRYDFCNGYISQQICTAVHTAYPSIAYSWKEKFAFSFILSFCPSIDFLNASQMHRTRALEAFYWICDDISVKFGIHFLGSVKLRIISWIGVGIWLLISNYTGLFKNPSSVNSQVHTLVFI